MKITKPHLVFIVSGILLAVSCMILSCMDCFHYTSFNGWTMEGKSSYIGFLSGIFILGGLAEIVLLFFRNRLLRVLAVLVGAGKTVIPWFLITMMNAIGTSMMDAKFEYTMCSNIPYIITALSALLIVQSIVMIFALPPIQKAVPM